VSNPVGRPPDLVREAWAMRFGITYRVHNAGDLTDALLKQLSFCRSDEARRIILGVSEVESETE
jgi:hypothetical protein